MFKTVVVVLMQKKSLSRLKILTGLRSWIWTFYSLASMQLLPEFFQKKAIADNGRRIVLRAYNPSVCNNCQIVVYSLLRKNIRSIFAKPI